MSLSVVKKKSKEVFVLLLDYFHFVLLYTSSALHYYTAIVNLDKSMHLLIASKVYFVND